MALESSSAPVGGVVFFERRELDQLMRLYGRMVAAGEWRDYGIAGLSESAVFSIFRHAAEAPAMLRRLQQAVIDNDNVFAVLMDAVRCCSLGQITSALCEVGGQYRRNM